MKNGKTVLGVIIVSLLASCAHRKLLETPAVNPEGEIDPHSGYIYGCFQNHYMRDWHHEAITFALELRSVEDHERKPKIIHIQFTDIVHHSSPSEIIEFGFSSINEPGKDIQLIKLPPGEYKITNVFYTNTDGKIRNKLSDSEPDVQDSFTVKPGMLTYIGSLRGETITEFSRSRWRIRGIYDYFPEETCYLEKKFPKTKNLERYNIFTKTLCSRPVTLIAAMRDENVYAMASSELVNMGASAVKPLLAVLEAENVNIRKGAARTLGRIGEYQAVEPLINILKEDSDSNVRKSAAIALGDIGNPQAVEPLIDALDDVNRGVQQRSVNALKHIGNPAIEQLITALKQNKTSDVRKCAAHILGDISDIKSIEPLIEALKDYNNDVRIEAETSLKSITGCDFKSCQGNYDRWKKWWKQNQARYYLKWKYNTHSCLESAPAVSNETLFLGSNDGNIYALDAAEGSVMWKYRTGDNALSSPAVNDGTVFVGSRDGNIYALDTSSGALQWRYKAGKRVVSGPAVGDGTVYIGLRDGSICALDATEGTLKWKYKSIGNVYNSQDIVDGTIYTASNLGYFHALNAAAGTVKWRKYFLSGSFHTSPAVKDGTVYVGSFDMNINHYIFAIDTAEGKLKWKFETHSFIDASPAVADNMVYIGCRDNYVYALEKETGTLKWKFKTGSWIVSSMAAGDGIVYAGSYDGYIYALDVAAGTLKWKFKTGNRILAAPLMAGGLLYVCSNDGYIYAFEEAH